MKLDRLLSFGLLAALGMACVLAVTVLVDGVFRHYIDSGIYVLCAKNLASGAGYVYQGQPFFVRPPGLSLLLAPLLSEPIDFERLNLVIQITVAGCWITLALAMRRLHGPLLGTAVALLFALNPLGAEWQNTVLAEFPFMLALFAGAWLLLPGADGRQVGWARGIAGTVLLALSAWFRSSGLLVLPGLVLADLFRREGRRWQGAVLAGLFMLLVAPWMAWGARAASQAPRPSTQLKMFDYTTALLRTDTRDPESPYVDLDGWIERIATNTRGVVRTTGEMFVGARDGTLPWVVTALCAIAMLITWFSRRSLLDWYMAATAAIVLTYFIFVPRLLLPLVPMMISSLVYSADRLGRWLARRQQQPRLAALPVVLVCAVLGSAGLAQLDRALRYPPGRAVLDKMDRVSCDWLREHTPEDSVVLAERAAIINLLSGRMTYTHRNLPGPWPQGCPHVDFAVYSGKLEVEQRIAAAAREHTVLPVRWRGRIYPVRIYRMGAMEWTR